MKEKKNGKIIFVVVVVLILALQAPVRMGVYHFFTRNSITNQIGVKNKTQSKIGNDSNNIFKSIQKEVEHILDGIKGTQKK